MLSIVLLLSSFLFIGVGLCFAAWERKEIRTDIPDHEFEHWSKSHDKYGPGVAVKSPPYSVLTKRGQFYSKAKFVFLGLGATSFVVLVVNANT
jgi:hypothetical protein